MKHEVKKSDSSELEVIKTLNEEKIKNGERNQRVVHQCGVVYRRPLRPIRNGL